MSQHREERIHGDPITTFDSGATPKVGEKRIKPRNLADVDLSALQHRMAATIERAKADDPKELRKRIEELEKEAQARLEAPEPAAGRAAAKEALDKAALRGAGQMANQMAKEFGAIVGAIRKAALHAVVRLRAVAAELEAAAPAEKIEFKAMIDLPAEADLLAPQRFLSHNQGPARTLRPVPARRKNASDGAAPLD